MCFFVLAVTLQSCVGWENAYAENWKVILFKTTFRRLTMRKFTLPTFAVASLTALLSTLPAHAQATRTWVSGVGDDANPCSRTAPCKTFAGAISKTAPKGEINVLDPGGFGGVTITKSITIASEYVEAGVLVSGTNAIIINGAGVVVTLRGLDIEGVGTGLNGINFLQGSSLHVQNCTIRGFNGPNATGISFTPGTEAQLFVTDTLVMNNGQVAAGNGIVVRPTGSGNVTAVFTRVTRSTTPPASRPTAQSTPATSTCRFAKAARLGIPRTESGSPTTERASSTHSSTTPWFQAISRTVFVPMGPAPGFSTASLSSRTTAPG
jgi:hypothetical protein